MVLGCDYPLGAGGFKEFVEEGAEVDHGQAQVFGGGAALGVALHDLGGRAVVLDQRPIISPNLK